jgi:hypothetical protein
MSDSACKRLLSESPGGALLHISTTCTPYDRAMARPLCDGVRIILDAPDPKSLEVQHDHRAVRTMYVKLAEITWMKELGVLVKGMSMVATCQKVQSSKTSH